MERRHDWPERLIEVIDRHRAQPFAWGAFDCGTLFGEGVAAVTGVNPLAGHTWHDETSALRVLVALGVTSMTELAERLFDEIVPVDARRGDIGVVALESDRLASPAIVTGGELMQRHADGWIVLPRSALVRAFKVG